MVLDKRRRLSGGSVTEKLIPKWLWHVGVTHKWVLYFWKLGVWHNTMCNAPEKVRYYVLRTTYHLYKKRSQMCCHALPFFERSFLGEMTLQASVSSFLLAVERVSFQTCVSSNSQSSSIIRYFLLKLGHLRTISFMQMAARILAKCKYAFFIFGSHKL